MPNANRERLLLLVGAVLFLAGALLPHGSPNAGHATVALRVAGILCFAAVAAGRRTLTPWIFVAMIAGAEIGFDAPKFAVNLQVLSDIFLRLIKTIVAPLILATLITGIAGAW